MPNLLRSFRIHIKYHGWDIWYHFRCMDELEAEQRARRDMEEKSRSWVPLASIVDADEVSMKEQQQMDEQLPDALTVLDKRPPEEVARDVAAQHQMEQEAATRILKAYQRSQGKLAWLREAAAKRAAQMKEDAGQFKQVHRGGEGA